MKNPFKYGCVVEGEYFCPRPQLHKQLAAYIESGQNVVIQGARRMGKTSLIKETVGSMRGYRLLFVDLYCIRSLSDFCRRVMTGVGEASAQMSFLKKAMSLVGRLRPVLSFDTNTGSPTIEIDAANANEPDSLGVTMGMIRKLASEEKMCVVFDEFQDILDLENADSILAEMRSTIQFQSEVPYLFSGSVRNEMARLFDDSESPFFKSAIQFTVGAIDKDEFAKFVVSRFKKGKRKIDTETAVSLIEYADSVSGDVQQICQLIWDSTDEGQTITLQDMNAAFELLFSREGELYGESVRQLTPLQVSVLRMLAGTSGLKTFSEEFMRKVGTNSTGALRTALKRLVAKRMIYLYGNEYRFVNPFFKEWIRRKM